MKNENFSDLSTEDLLKRQKTIKPLTILLIGTLVVLLVLSIFITIKKGFTALLVVPFALSPIAILNLNNLKSIQKEINSRKNQN
ncbi:redox-active disulfide protein 2 [Elizabethkingia sp. HX WHF]|uniref:redox-active disulfide protein 2 n=1 Tax=Elizabethkingia TaxID=308865 RepID=UPI0009995986|nr:MULTISPECIES: redox-active disulfide protein 2 [Elizabethkingia]ATL42745.1 redox-active disulfide protein 2 [Elizabethkingia miricola]MCL1637302.1 redox-active disulfide protein 2 [Elizabethkingia bruuniana]MDX8563395.1 redox-active disulfide protein 2 [Elizabethkingia sp. HX WHF]OPC19929.1 redox-active disulfide protein 2 [Elizabethkingia bruuniana]OPC58996.1 redox-active disulfide protein 2 [Elizabethkingia bruuniana]